jgi:hypothetical protein
METQNLRIFIADALKDAELTIKLNEMTNHVLGAVVNELNDIKNKKTKTETLSEDTIKEIIREQGFDYIVAVMDTITDFQFNQMVFFLDLINQLKGTRDGIELVLKLMGFDSIIKEWWEGAQFDQDPWTYEIIVIVNSSNVPDLFNTLDKVKEFSQNYVIAKVTNIEVRFFAENFAQLTPIMAGFSTRISRGRILQRANP